MKKVNGKKDCKHVYVIDTSVLSGLSFVYYICKKCKDFRRVNGQRQTA